VPGSFTWPGPVDDESSCAKFLVPPVLMDWPDEVPKPRVGLVADRDAYPYWTKFRRFLRTNDIPFRPYDIHRSDWRRQAEDLDAVIWRPMGFPSELEECRRKMWILEHYLDKLCYPSVAEARIYEDKMLQYELLDELGFPAVPTFVSYSEEEALAHVASRSYPAVWKIGCGAGSYGVELLKDRRQAERLVRQVFSFAGRRTYWPYAAQKDYVYLQPLEPNAGYDLRVMVVGDYVQGYYRTVPRGEFRASGMGDWYFAPLPVEAMRLARRVAGALQLTMVALDLLADPAETTYSIIEVSVFTQILDVFGLELNGVPGAYVFTDDECRFTPMRVVTQDLVLQELLERRWVAPRLAVGHPSRSQEAREADDKVM